MTNHLRDLADQEFGLLTVVCRASSRGKRTYWVCVCRCTPGREVEIRADLLIRERGVRSCGCLKRQNAGLFIAKPDDQIGYLAAHDRVRKVRGPASQHRCVACSGQAREWALKREAGTRLVVGSGQFEGLWFSPDSGDYQPMCNSCHSRYDRRAA